MPMLMAIRLVWAINLLDIKLIIHYMIFYCFIMLGVCQGSDP